MLLRTILVVATVISFAGCDVSRVLTIKASKHPNASVTIYANSNIVPRDTAGSPQKIVIHVPTHNSNARDTGFWYGFGNWGRRTEIAAFAKDIDSIIINNGSGKKLELKNQPDLVEYLLKRRRGIFKNVMVIKAK